MQIRARGIQDEEARQIFEQHWRRARAMTYEELRDLAEPQVSSATGLSGMAYQLELESFFDDRSKKDIRVFLRLDAIPGERGKSLSLLDDFIVSPEGKFVGE